MNLHISDYFQEFLSVPDQLKLIEFDNKKIKEIQKFNTEVGGLTNRSEFLGVNLLENQRIASSLSKQSSSLGAGAIKPKEKIADFIKRIDSLMDRLEDEEQGFGRFKYGKDWTRCAFEDGEFVRELDDLYVQRIMDQKMHLEAQGRLI